jgi:ABC-type proline/glycine betaine transport system permease subunit
VLLLVENMNQPLDNAITALLEAAKALEMSAQRARLAKVELGLKGKRA